MRSCPTTTDLAIAPDVVLGGRYRLRSRLGHGGMAMVWLGFDERLERPVAVKIMSDTLAGDERLSGSASAARRA